MTRATLDGSDEAIGRLREAAGRLYESARYRGAFAREVRSIPNVSVDEPVVDSGFETGGDAGER